MDQSTFMGAIVGWVVGRACDFCWSRRSFVAPLIPAIQNVSLFAALTFFVYGFFLRPKDEVPQMPEGLRGPGRLGWLPTQAPHRSGRTELPYPAPHLMISLRRSAHCGPLARGEDRTVSPGVRNPPTQMACTATPREPCFQIFAPPPGIPGDWGNSR